MQITSQATSSNLYLYINQSEIVAIDWQGFKKHYAQQMTIDQETQVVMDLVTNETSAHKNKLDNLQLIQLLIANY